MSSTCETRSRSDDDAWPEDGQQGSCPEPSPAPSLELANAINALCPRSGKPVVATSLTTYRGYTVGFCNEGCRDDFAANIADRPDDRRFFDLAIAEREGA